MNKVAIISKYLPYYRLAVFNRLSQIDEPKYEIVADSVGREGIITIPEHFALKSPAIGGISWSKSKSYYYKKSLQFWQTKVVSKIFKRQYKLFILDGASSHISTWIFSSLCRIAGKKVIFWSHGLKGTDKGLQKFIRNIFFKFMPHGLILYGDFSRDLMIKQGFNPDKIFVIGNSLNYLEQKEIRDRLLMNKTHLADLKAKIFKSDFKTIIFIGRLVPNKKVNRIIEALQKLKSQNLNLNCIIIGDGPDKEVLTSKISESGLSPQFYFPGELYDEEQIAELFLISDLMLSPGNVGLNCIHALAYGVPVITHNNFSYQNPEVESIKHGKNGLLYNHGDFSDMHVKIRDWFSVEHPEIMKECIEPIENKFNPENHSERINKAVLKVLDA
jgi:glycosyltransferase involved in cell wall biosynthesis